MPAGLSAKCFAVLAVTLIGAQERPKILPLHFTSGSWSNAQVKDWAYKVEQWDSETIRLLGLFDEANIKGSAGIMSEYAQAVQSNVQAMKRYEDGTSRITRELESHPYDLDVFEEVHDHLVSVSAALDQFAALDNETELTGVPSRELATKFIVHSTEATALLKSVMDHRNALLGWYKATAGVPAY